MFRNGLKGTLTLSGVVPGGVAEAAGLRSGDILVEINAEPVSELSLERRQQSLLSSPLDLVVERQSEESTERLTFQLAHPP